MIIMKKIWIFFLIGMIGCSSSWSDDPEFELTQKSAEFINTNNDFGIKLFRRVLSDDERDNILISPTSVSLALGMTYNGASGSTKEAYDQVFDYEGLNREEANEISKELIKTLVTNSKGNQLDIANAIWYRNNLLVYDAFVKLNKTYFGASVKPLNFSDAGSIEVINNWVADHTNDKITEIIKRLSPSDMMVLVNALYFNCLWEVEFDPGRTKEEMFYKEDGTQYKKVPMMHSEDAYRYAETKDFAAIELPYKNKKFSMYIFLPATGNTVKNLVENLDSKQWGSWLSIFREYKDVNLTMPKFKFSYDRTLNDDLSDMGLGIAFTGAADFSEISDVDLMISRVIHKTYIDVNEKGTEAAAVTGAVMELTSMGPPAPRIKLDRPFLFAITENTSQAIVFMGKMGAPNH